MTTQIHIAGGLILESSDPGDNVPGLSRPVTLVMEILARFRHCPPGGTAAIWFDVTKMSEAPRQYLCRATVQLDSQVPCFALEDLPQGGLSITYTDWHPTETTHETTTIVEAATPVDAMKHPIIVRFLTEKWSASPNSPGETK